MARFVAFFRDDPAADSVRKLHDRDHFAYLEAHRDRIVLAGGLRAGPGEWYCGGLWILEVAHARPAAVVPGFEQELERPACLAVAGRRRECLDERRRVREAVEVEAGIARDLVEHVARGLLADELVGQDDA